MPRKIRQLVSDLDAAGFAHVSTRGSHRKFNHGPTDTTVILAGASGDDAKHYMEKDVRKAIERSKGTTT